MIRVFIADDEVFVLQLIQRIIDWKALGMEIVGTANDGISALEKILELVPDIIIVDVRMPGIDGITLMQRVRAVNERVKFIIISGHKKFEYAKSAMQYNVEDYILKPIDEKELENILKKLKQQIELMAIDSEQSKNIVRQLDDSRKNLNRYFLEQFAKGDLQKELVHIDEVNEKYFTQFENGTFKFVIVHLNIFEKVIDQSFLKRTVEVLDEHFLQMTMKLCHCVVGQTFETYTMYLLNYPEEKEKQITDQLRSYHTRIEGIIDKFEKLQANICVGTAEKSLYEAWCSLEMAKKCQQSRLVLGTNKIIYPSMVKSDSGIMQVIFSDISRQNIQANIKSFDKNKLKVQVLETFTLLEQYRSRDTCIYYKTAEAFLEYLFDYLSRIELYDKSHEAFKSLYTSQLNLCTCSSDVSRLVISIISDLIDAYMVEKTEYENPAIRIAKRYVAEHYKKDLSLTMIAEIVNLSPVYFSILFKKVVSVNFLDYLNQYRIEQSKALLKDVRNNMSDVAGQIGFSDARHFMRVFKKYMGITPSEYRQRCSDLTADKAK